MSAQIDPAASTEDGSSGPYLAILVVALLIGVGLAVYVLGYRDQIIAILTQSPT